MVTPSRIHITARHDYMPSPGIQLCSANVPGYSLGEYEKKSLLSVSGIVMLGLLHFVLSIYSQFISLWFCTRAHDPLLPNPETSSWVVILTNGVGGCPSIVLSLDLLCTTKYFPFEVLFVLPIYFATCLLREWNVLLSKVTSPSWSKP